jgi:hypothetical protein
MIISIGVYLVATSNALPIKAASAGRFGFCYPLVKLSKIFNSLRNESRVRDREAWHDIAPSR